MAVWNRLQGAIGGMAVGAAARDAVVPVLETARQSAWGQRAVLVLNAATAARASVRGIDRNVDYEDDAKRNGIGRNRFAILKDLEVSFPGVGEVLAWYRRHPEGRDVAEAALRRQGYNTEWTDRLLTLARVPVPASDLIRMAVREVFSPGLRDRLDLDADFPAAVLDPAAEVGLSSEAMRNYWAAHWDLPSYTQLTEMLHRGELTPAQYDDALRAADYAPTWRGKLKAIAVRIAPISDMIRFAVRDVYDAQRRQELGLDAEFPQAFADAASLHGQTEETSRQYWAAHWRLPSAMQGYRMWHRGEMSEADLDSLLKALDYPPLWRKRLKAIAHLVPGRIDLKRMLEAGVRTFPEVVAGYRALGYSDADALQMAQIAARQETDPDRELTATDLREQYEEGLISQVQYESALLELGYTPDAIAAKVRLATMRLETQARKARTARIKSTYVGHKISFVQAQEAMAEAGLPAETIARVLPIWEDERAVNVTVLTAAQVRQAFRRAQMTRADAVDALMDRGYSEEDAAIFLELGPKS